MGPSAFPGNGGKGTRVPAGSTIGRPVNARLGAGVPNGAPVQRAQLTVLCHEAGQGKGQQEER
jgi:hypothetical protein